MHIAVMASRNHTLPFSPYTTSLTIRANVINAPAVELKAARQTNKQTNKQTERYSKKKISA